MKYINKNNNRVAELIEENPKSKTVTLQYIDDGKFTGITVSTFKRWWKQMAVPEAGDVDEVMRQKNELGIECPEIKSVELVPMPGTEKLAELKEEYSQDEDKAGDGTPLAEVGKEIAKQAKEKTKKAREKKKEKKSSEKNTAIKEELQAEVLKVLDDNNIKYVIKEPKGIDLLDEKHKWAGIYMGNKKFVIMFKENTVPVDARPDRIRNCPFSHSFDICLGDSKKLDTLIKGRR